MKRYTVRDFMKVQRIQAKEYENPVEKLIDVMSAYRGSYQGDKPYKELKKDFDREHHNITQPQRKLKGDSFRFKGRRFKFILDPRDINAGQFIDVSNLTKKPEDYANNYNKIIALLIKEDTRLLKRHLTFDQKAEFVLDVPAEVVNPVLVFFLNLSTEFLKATSESLQEEAIRLKEQSTLVSDTDG